MDKYDRGFITVILFGISVVLFLMNLQAVKLKNGIEQLAVRVVALESELLDVRLKNGENFIGLTPTKRRDVGIGFGTVGADRFDDCTQMSNGGTAYLRDSDGPMEGRIPTKSTVYIDTPIGGWDPIKDKSIGVTFGKPFHINIPISHTSDPLSFPRNSVRMFSH
jgi:hypothetical protein